MIRENRDSWKETSWLAKKEQKFEDFKVLVGFSEAVLEA